MLSFLFLNYAVIVIIIITPAKHYLSSSEINQQAPECRRSRYRSLDGSCNSRVNSNFGRTGDDHDHDHDHDYDHPDNDDDSTNLIIRFTDIKKQGLTLTFPPPKKTTQKRRGPNNKHNTDTPPKKVNKIQAHN